MEVNVCIDETVRPSTRTTAPPGGASSIFLGFKNESELTKPHTSKKQTPGTASSICLNGSDKTPPMPRTNKKHIATNSSGNILGAAIIAASINEAAIPAKKHVIGTKQATIYIGEDGPVEPAPPGRKHINASNGSLHLRDEPVELPPSPTRKKIVPGGSRTTITLNESNAPVEPPPRNRKHGGATKEGLSVFRMDGAPEPETHAKKHVAGVSASIDLSDRSVDITHKAGRRVYQLVCSEMVLADDAPLVAPPMSRRHTAQGRSSIRFGEGAVEQVQPSRRRDTAGLQSSGMREALSRPEETDSTSQGSSSTPSTPTKSTTPLTSPTKIARTPTSAEGLPPHTSPAFRGLTPPHVPSSHPGVRSLQAPGGTSTLVLG